MFGVNMETTSQAGSGPAMPIGNTPRPTPAPRAEAEPNRGGVTPVPAYQVTTMPLPQGRCDGKYTEAAKLAGIEGTVVLDLVVDERGRVRDVRVVSGLGHGLTEAAIAAVKQCRFSPGEKDGTPVPVRVSTFKIRFLMQDAE
jgi:protein TonB